MKVLIACEESQRVCTAFRERGHEAYSCDIIEPSGGHPEWHIMGDCLKVLNGGAFFTMDGTIHDIVRWDLIIAHPPCTYLTVTANKYYEVAQYGNKARERMKERYKAIVFFTRLMDAPADKVVVENPVGIMSGAYRKPDQIIQPYMFGDPFEKKTCLWLKNVPMLKPTNVVEPPPRQIVASGKTLPRWYSNCGGDRKKERSKTFPGVAKAMAEQWG